MTLNCAISRHNLDTLDQMADLARQVGADVLQIQHTIFNWPDQVERHNRLFSPKWAKTHGLDVVQPSIPEAEYYRSELQPADLPRLLAALNRLGRRNQGRPRVVFLPALPSDLTP